MSLTNLFNKNFIKENIKRSKAIILLIIFLIPVINVIYFLMSNSNSSYKVPTIFEIQPLSMIGLYLIPVILSLTLFSFVYKRKSADFVISLPISKKEIFTSNTISGIIIIFIMNLVNYLFTLIASLMLKNIIIDYKMLFDIFLLWTISYIFVFCSTNIGVSISSNKITTIVVTILILFLVPFTHTFIVSNEFKGIYAPDIETYCDNELCKPKNYKCYSTSCEIKKANNIYPSTYYEEIEENKNYTIPYSLIFEFLMGKKTGNINKSLIKMTFLSIIYTLLGVILFKKKKIETVDISFKSEKMHLIVRSLTTVPILCIYYIILKNAHITISDIFTIIFLVVIIITYLIIYDLLTRRKITNILKSLIALMIVGISVISLGEISSSNQITQIKVNDIEKMTFIDENMVNQNGYTENKELINYIISIHIDNIKSEENYFRNFNIRINIDNKLYEFRISVTKEQYEHIINELSNDKTYQKTSKKIKIKNTFAIKLDGDNSLVSKNSSLYDKIIKEFTKSTVIQNEQANNIFTVAISMYDNFEVKTVYYDVKNSILQQEILNHYNSEVSKIFEDPEVNIHTYYIGNYDNINHTVSEDYLSHYYQNENIEINKFILNNLNNKVDINKEYRYIKFYTNNTYRTTNIFVTNKVEELEALVEEIKKQEEKNDIGDTYDKFTY